MEMSAIVCVRMCRDNGELCDYLNALSEHVLKARIVGVLVVGIKRENAGCHFIHYRARGRLHKNILGKSRRKLTIMRKKRVEIIKLGLARKLAKEKKIYYLLKAVSVLGIVALYELSHIEASVFKLSLIGYLLALINVVTVNVTDCRNARHNSGAVLLTKTSFNSVVFKGRGRNAVGILGFLKTAGKDLAIKVAAFVIHS